MTLDELLYVCPLADQSDIKAAACCYNAKADACRYSFTVEPMTAFAHEVELLKNYLLRESEDRERVQVIADLLKRGCRQYAIVCWDDPRQHTGVVLEGLHRLLAADALGLPTVPVIYIDPPDA